MAKLSIKEKLRGGVEVAVKRIMYRRLSPMDQLKEMYKLPPRVRKFDTICAAGTLPPVAIADCTALKYSRRLIQAGHV